KAASSAPRNSSHEPGMRTRTRSPTPSVSQSRHCANVSASRGSSPRCPAWATESTRNQPGSAKTVHRAPGLSVRLKLTLSYAGFVMLAGAFLLVVGYVSLSRGVHPGVIFMVRSHSDLLQDFAPTAAVLGAFLLVFG